MKSKQNVVFAKILLTIILCSFLILFCKQSANDGSSRLQIATSLAPQKYFIDKIGGSLVDVTVMVPPGASPHTYEPKPAQMTKLSVMKLYFTTGMEFENVWLPRFRQQFTNMKIIPLDSGITKVPIVDDDAYEKLLPGGHNRHEHDGLDPHIWLSPSLVKLQASTILNALSAVDPSHAEQYRLNYHKFTKEIDGLQQRLTTMLSSDSGMTFLVFHPTWGYFANEFNLKQVAIELEGREPGPKELSMIITLAREHGIKTIFIQPQNSDRTARIIAKTIGGSVVKVDPQSYDWPMTLITFAGELNASRSGRKSYSR